MDINKLSPHDHSNIKFKSLFIDMDLAMHQISSNSPRIRRLRKSLDSHEDFEFSMSHMLIDDDSLDQAMEVTSADKLFFKGQILPLQRQAADPKRQLLQPTLACPSLDFCEKRNSFQSLHTLNQSWRRYLAATSENSLEKHDSEKDCFTICHNEEIISTPLQYCRSQGGTFHSPHLMYTNEEGTSGVEFTLQDRIDIMPSCSPLDGTFGPDSCSSSFRSHHSNSYWSSAEKDSRDSSSSSRCSNGSHHDSAYIQSIEKKAPQSMSMQLKASHPVHQSELCEIMGDLSLSANPSHRPNHPIKPPTSASLSAKKWTWKGLFTSLRKASKLRVDDGRGDVERKNTALKGAKRAVFTFKELPGLLGEDAISYRRSVGHDREWQANTYQFVSRSEGLVKKGSQHAKGSWGTALRTRDDCEDQQLGTAIYCLRGGGRQEAAAISIDGGPGELTSKREKGPKVQLGNVWNAKENWNSCLNKMKKGSTKLAVSAACKLVPNKELMMESNMQSNNGASRIMKEEDKLDIHRLMKAKSLSSTPLAKSPVRTSEYAGSYVGIYAMQGGASAASSSNYSSAMKKSCDKKVGFAASCPASMRSSPHHSGLLAIVNKATPDLHTAIQGAIAHCKQSQVAAAAATPPPRD